MTLGQAEMDSIAAASPQQEETAPAGPKNRRRAQVYLGRVIVLAVFLVLWQYLPEIHWLSSRMRFLDPFFISSPSKAAVAVYDFMLGQGGRPLIWPYLWQTVRSSLEGLAIGSCIGFALGLLLSSVPILNDIIGMFIQAVNSIPRLALIPLVIAVAGIGATAEVSISLLGVFFVVFYNCLEGGRRVPPAILDNTRVLGASPVRTMLHVRVRYVLLWAYASIPNATAFSLLGVISMQLVAGTGGIGVLMLVAINQIDTTTNIALIVYLSVTGVVMVQLAQLTKRRLLFWAENDH